MRNGSPSTMTASEKTQDRLKVELSDQGNSVAYKLQDGVTMSLRYLEGRTHLEFGFVPDPNDSISSIGRTSNFRTDQAGKLVEPFEHSRDPKLYRLSRDEESAIKDILRETVGVVSGGPRRAPSHCTSDDSHFATKAKGPSERQKGEQAASGDYDKPFDTIAKMTKERVAPDVRDYENLFADLHEMTADRSSAGSTAWEDDDPDL